MQQILTDKLRAFIAYNNPDLLIRLQQAHNVTDYLQEKVTGVMPLATRLLEEGNPLYLTEELCVEAMTEELKPSRYHYIRSLLEEDFSKEFERMQGCGILRYETIHLVEICKQVFDDFGFSDENEADRMLRYAILGELKSYLT